MTTFVELTANVEERLELLSTQTGRAKMDLLSEMIERGLEDMEDYYSAAEVREKIRRGEESIMTGEEFWRGLDS